MDISFVAFYYWSSLVCDLSRINHVNYPIIKYNKHLNDCVQHFTFLGGGG